MNLLIKLSVLCELPRAVPGVVSVLLNSRNLFPLVSAQTRVRSGIYFDQEGRIRWGCPELFLCGERLEESLLLHFIYLLFGCFLLALDLYLLIRVLENCLERHHFGKVPLRVYVSFFTGLCFLRLGLIPTNGDLTCSTSPLPANSLALTWGLLMT